MWHMEEELQKEGVSVSLLKEIQKFRERFFIGCFTWIRTKINGVRVRCPTIRR